MGIKFFSGARARKSLSPNIGFSNGHNAATSFYEPAPKDGNPNKYRYKILKTEKIGSALVVQINYPDCFNYNGNKICVYDDASKFFKLHEKGCIDPHFLEKDYSPIARFEPTTYGWNLAVNLAKTLK